MPYTSSEEEGDSIVLAEVWYLFENNVADSSGNGWNGSYSGSYDASNYKQGSYGIEFESSDILTVGDFDIDNDTIAIGFWYYHPSNESDDHAAKIAVSGNTTNGWSLEIDQPNGDVEFHKYVSGTDYQARTTNGQIGEDAWYYILMQTYGNLGGNCKIYVNNSDVTYDDDTDASGTFDTGQIEMGSNLNSTLDNVTFFNHMFLTSDQRTYLYQHPSTTLKDPPE
jgi:hypothetical protein